MKCLVCLLHIAKRSNHLGCMGSIIFTNISDSTSSVRSDVIHNTTDNLSLFVSYYNPQIEMFARFKMKSSFHKTKRII